MSEQAERDVPILLAGGGRPWVPREPVLWRTITFRTDSSGSHKSRGRGVAGRPLESNVGRRFGALTVIRMTGATYAARVCICRCECGTTVERKLARLHETMRDDRSVPRCTHGGAE